MKSAKLSLHPDFVVGSCEDTMFGDFEQTTPNGSRQFDPDSRFADDQGFRSDMIAQLKEFGLGIVRFPGGSNMCLYRWKDGIGPKEERIARTYYTGHMTDHMPVGIDEMFDYCSKIGCKVMLDVRAGFASGALDDIYDELDYIFSTGDGYYPSLRRKNGHDDPYHVDYICIGNEEDGNWEFCQHSPESYAHFAREAAKLIRYFSPDTKIIVCGTSNPAVATYPEWDRILLDAVYEYVDFLSIHYIRVCNPNMMAGVKEPPVGVEDLAYLNREFTDFIETSQSVISYIKSKHKAGNKVGLSIEEWSFPGIPDHVPDGLGWTEITKFTDDDYRALGLEPGKQKPGMFLHVCTLIEALLYGQAYIVMLNHADSVKISTGGFGMSLRAGTDTILKGLDYYVAESLSKNARGTVLRCALQSPDLETLRYGTQPAVSAAAVLSGNKLTVFALNMHYSEDCTLDIDLSAFKLCKVTGHTVIYDDQPLAGNTFVQPGRILPKDIPVDAAASSFILKKHSWNVITFEVQVN